MGEKDKIEKLLEDYPDVFADIINVLVYQGEEVVKPERNYGQQIYGHNIKHQMMCFMKKREIL